MAQSLIVFRQTTVESFTSLYFLIFGLFIIFTQCREFSQLINDMEVV